jgi:hypothetical protein
MRIIEEIAGLVHRFIWQLELFQACGEVGLVPLPERRRDLGNEPAAMLDAAICRRKARIA